MNRTIIQIVGLDGVPQRIQSIHQQNYNTLLFITKDVDEELDDHLTICIFESDKQFKQLKNVVREMRKSQIRYFLIKIGQFELTDQEQQEFSECIYLDSFNLDFCGLEEYDKPNPIQIQDLQDYFSHNKNRCCNIF